MWTKWDQKMSRVEFWMGRLIRIAKKTIPGQIIRDEYVIDVKQPTAALGSVCEEAERATAAVDALAESLGRVEKMRGGRDES